MGFPLAAIVVGRRVTWRVGSNPAVNRTTTVIATVIRRWALEAIGLRRGNLAGVANRLRRVCEGLDSVGIERKVVEIRNL